MRVDLHSHSDQSDGSLTPADLVDHALAAGLEVLALTDHDTTAGHDRFRARAQMVGLIPVCGVEVSCTWPHQGQCHLLGLGVRNDHAPLESALLEIRGGRDHRNERIIARLDELGYRITLAEVTARAGGDVVARPHFAQVLHDRGLVSSYQQAFDDLLASGKPAYVDRFRLDPEEAVELVTSAGGRAVLAHPPQLRLAPEGLADLARRLLPHGLWGLEVYFTGVTDAQIACYQKLAADLGLTVCMGSDFHGDAKPHVAIGHYRPGCPLPGPCPAELLP